MSHSRIIEPRYFLAALTILGLLASGPSCSSGGDDPDDTNKGGGGGTGGGGGKVAGEEICGNGLDDDENGLTDCQDEVCARTEECCPECFTQCGIAGQAACQSKIDGTVEVICSPAGMCERSGEVDANGDVRKGEALVTSNMNEIKSTMQYKAHQIIVLSSIRPNTTEPATCQAIMAREIDPADPGIVNIVHKATIPVQAEGDSILAGPLGVPLPKEGQKLLVVARFFVAHDSSLNPVGDIVGEGCSEYASIPEGSYVGDEANPDRNWGVVIRFYCGGFLKRSCPEPKTCVVGFCRDTRCEPACSTNYTCREWEGTPACRKTCNPDNPDCPNLHRCDATPGEPAVCVPAQ